MDRFAAGGVVVVVDRGVAVSGTLSGILLVVNWQHGIAHTKRRDIRAGVSVDSNLNHRRSSRRSTL